MHKQIFTVILIFLLFFAGCGSDLPGGFSGKNEHLQFNSSVYLRHLKHALITGGDQIIKASIHYGDTIYLYYTGNSLEPIFIKSFEEEGFITSLIEILNAAETHGLDPEMYHASLIKDEYLKAVSGDSIYEARYEHLANTELLAADAILKYAWHIRYGVVNPKELYSDSYFLPVPASLSRDLFEPLRQKDIIQYLYNIQPKSKRYTSLQEALKYYQKFTTMDFLEIAIPEKKIEPGNSNHLMSSIRERLIALEFLDTSIVKIQNFEEYDSLTAIVVKEFQRRNGLVDDGIIGKATVEKLNVSPSENLEKIKLTLERFRWTDYTDSSRYILVNIPDFHMYAVENGNELFKIRVCTGRKRNAGFEAQMELYKKTMKLYHKPEDWETPLLISTFTNLVLNPTWTVPQSIIREEIASAVRKDSTYLLRKNFQVFKDGISVDPGAIPSVEFLRSDADYRVVQDPGPWNALGKIKFMFKNPFGVYLHDTPSRSPFNLSNRAVSHGCVRVEKPMQFAEFLLRSHSQWNLDYLKIEIGLPVEDKTVKEDYYKKRSQLRKDFSYGKTTEVKLEKTVHVIIDYYTAWVDSEGKINFRDDVYRQDEILSGYLFPHVITDEKLAMK